MKRFRDFLDTLRFRVEPYGEAEALRYAARIHERDAWRRLARDAMIAGHVRGEDQLWTANPRDFLEIGVPAGQVVDVPLG